MLAGAVAGGVAGALFDQFTCTLSPEYFRDGKGVVATGAAFRFAVALIGFRGGLSIGALVAGTDLLVRARRPELGRAWWVPHVLVTTVAAIIACSALFAAVDPFALGSQAHAWDTTVLRRFLLAWGCHVGAYVGSVAGIATATFRALRKTA